MYLGLTELHRGRQPVNTRAAAWPTLQALLVVMYNRGTRISLRQGIAPEAVPCRDESFYFSHPPGYLGHSTSG